MQAQDGMQSFWESVQLHSHHLRTRINVRSCISRGRSSHVYDHTERSHGSDHLPHARLGETTERQNVGHPICIVKVLVLSR